MRGARNTSSEGWVLPSSVTQDLCKLQKPPQQEQESGDTCVHVRQSGAGTRLKMVAERGENVRKASCSWQGPRSERKLFAFFLPFLNTKKHHKNKGKVTQCLLLPVHTGFHEDSAETPPLPTATESNHVSVSSFHFHSPSFSPQQCLHISLGCLPCPYQLPK